MTTYPTIHLFIDESGDLTAGPRREKAMLVGGVLVLGDYDDALDRRLLHAVRTRLESVGGQFPADLHFSRSGLSADAAAQFLQELGSDIKVITAEHCEIRGVHAVHVQDIYEPQSVLAEQRYDNRYQSMLWSLVEHLVFVDQRVMERLSCAAQLHLHVASRCYIFDPRQVPVEDVQAFGWAIGEDRDDPARRVAFRVLDRRELAAMFRQSLRLRWRQSQITLGSVDVVNMDYVRGRSPAALFLADLYLGLCRQRELAHRVRYQPNVRANLLATFRRLDYGPWLELLARMQAALQAEDYEGYLMLAGEYQVLGEQHDLTAYQHIVRRQEKAVSAWLREHPQRLETLAEDACRLVDLPGGVFGGLQRADEALRLMGMAEVINPRAEMLVLQTLLSGHNHRGDVDGAELAWEQYLKQEPSLAALQTEGLRLMAEIRNRRAVSLTDRFRFDEAELALTELISVEEQLGRLAAELFGKVATEAPNYQLGACFGSLGQVYALQNRPETRSEAEKCFRRAMGLFAEPADIERQWIYLGHLACDRREAGRALWQEVVQAQPLLAQVAPITQPHGQYLLALQIKGRLVFDGSEELQRFLAAWEEQRPIEQYPPDEQLEHPFGLIQQAIGLCHERLWRETGAEQHAQPALRCFQEASHHLQQGGALLHSLGYLAQFREGAFALARSPESTGIQDRLKRAHLLFRAHLVEHFGDAAWVEEEAGRPGGFFGVRDPGPGKPWEQRATALANAVCFNYW